MSADKGNPFQWEPTWKDYVVSAAGGICFVGQVVLCFTSYNRLNSSQALYLGWTVLAVALLIGSSSRRALEQGDGTSKAETWFDVRVLADSGIHGVVRHPIYLSFMMVLLSLILISQHWLSAVLGLPWMVYLYLSMLWEEQAYIGKLGGAYLQYMRKVPRVNFVLGAIRHWQRRRQRAGD